MNHRSDPHPEATADPGHPRPAEHVLLWTDESACQQAAARLARVWTDPPAGPASAGGPAFTGTLTLTGPLGAGKTAFSRHLLRALGATGAIRSPTYTLVEPYELVIDHRRLDVVHCDFYRFEDPAEWEDAGLRELFSAASLRLVEWPDRAEGRLGPVDLALSIEPMLESTSSPAAPRRVVAQAHSACGLRWLEQLRNPT